MLGQISCSLASAPYRHAVIIGESGIIETSYSNHGSQADTLELRIKCGRVSDTPLICEMLPAGNGFRLEAEALFMLIRESAAGWPGITEQESLDTAITLEALATSLKSGRPQRIDRQQ